VRLCLGRVLDRRAHDLSNLLITDLRLAPPAGRTAPRSFKPSWAKRLRHALTVAGETSTEAAICVLATPSPASNKTRARWTSRWAATRDLESASRTSR